MWHWVKKLCELGPIFREVPSRNTFCSYIMCQRLLSCWKRKLLIQTAANTVMAVAPMICQGSRSAQCKLTCRRPSSRYSSTISLYTTKALWTHRHMHLLQYVRAAFNVQEFEGEKQQWSEVDLKRLTESRNSQKHYKTLQTHRSHIFHVRPHKYGEAVRCKLSIDEI